MQSQNENESLERGRSEACDQLVTGVSVGFEEPCLVDGGNGGEFLE